jgi:hypothetical protein
MTGFGFRFPLGSGLGHGCLVIIGVEGVIGAVDGGRLAVWRIPGLVMEAKAGD